VGKIVFLISSVFYKLRQEDAVKGSVPKEEWKPEKDPVLEKGVTPGSCQVGDKKRQKDSSQQGQPSPPNIQAKPLLALWATKAIRPQVAPPNFATAERTR
jgi:hypothetical protein